MDAGKAGKIEAIIKALKANPELYNKASEEARKKYSNLIQEYKGWKSGQKDFTLTIESPNGEISTQDVRAADPYNDPTEFQSIVQDIRDAGFKVKKFEPKEAAAQAEQAEADDAKKTASAIFGRSGMEYLEKGEPIKAGIVGGLTTIPRVVKGALEVAGSGYGDLGSLVAAKAKGLDPNKMDYSPVSEVTMGSLAGQGQGPDMLTNIAEDPSLIPAMMTGGALGGLSKIKNLGNIKRGMTLGLGETGAALGTRAALGEEMTPEQVATEGTLGALFGVGGELLGPLLKKGGEKVSGFIENSTEKLSGTPREALEMASTREGREALVEFAGRDMEVADNLINVIDNFEQYIPEWKSIQQTLQEMPSVDISGVNSAIEASLIKPKGGRPLLPWERKANSAIIAEFDYNIADIPNAMEYIDPKFYSELSGKALPSPSSMELSIIDDVGAPSVYVDQTSQSPMTMSAEGVYDIRKALDKEISPEAFAGIQNSNAVTDQVMKAKSKVRRELKESLIKTAKESGNNQYITDMEMLAKKLSKKEKLTQAVGAKEGTRQKRADILVSNITNKNKQRARIALQELDDLIGTNLSTQAKAVSYASALGRDGLPSFFPRQVTGMGTAMQVPITGGMASPYLASRVYQPAKRALQGVTGTLGQLMDDDIWAKMIGRGAMRAQDQEPTLGSLGGQ